MPSEKTNITKLRNLAEKGDAKTQLELGYLLLPEIFHDPDVESAAFWFRKSAEQGNDQAQLELGSI